MLKDYITIIRPVNCAMAGIAVWIGSVIASSIYMPSLSILYAIVAAFFISGAGMIANDYYDMQIDRINKPNRPLASGRMKKNIAAAYCAVLFVIGNALAYIINLQAFGVALAISLLLFMYAHKVKKIILLGNAIVSFSVAMTFVFGGVASGNYLVTAPIAGLAFFSNLGREMYKSIDDVEGDRKYGVNSLATKYGAFKSRIAANFFILLAVFLSFTPYVLGILGFAYLVVVIIADVIFLGCIFMPKKSAKLCKFAMILALIAFILSFL